jgi:hypothetical protein
LNPESYAWFGGTTLDNPYTPEEYKQDLVHQYEGLFKQQEIYGEFCGFEGQVYNNFRGELHVLKGLVGFDDGGVFIELSD